MAKAIKKTQPETQPAQTAGCGAAAHNQAAAGHVQRVNRDGKGNHDKLEPAAPFSKTNHTLALREGKIIDLALTPDPEVKPGLRRRVPREGRQFGGLRFLAAASPTWGGRAMPGLAAVALQPLLRGTRFGGLAVTGGGKPSAANSGSRSHRHKVIAEILNSLHTTGSGTNSSGSPASSPSSSASPWSLITSRLLRYPISHAARLGLFKEVEADHLRFLSVTAITSTQPTKA
jgi:hypothetical protein